MKRATITCTLNGTSPISFSRPVHSEKKTGEKSDAFERRTWKERAHTNEKGEIFIPPQALKKCLEDVAKYLGETVPGKGKATYTKHFKAGMMVTDPLMLGVHIDDVEENRVFVPSDGKAGGGKRVWKSFPLIREWSAQAVIHVFDPVLTDQVATIERFLKHAGSFIGMGTFRPINGGYFGRFTVEDFHAEIVGEH